MCDKKPPRYTYLIGITNNAQFQNLVFKIVVHTNLRSNRQKEMVENPEISLFIFSQLLTGFQ